MLSQLVVLQNDPNSTLGNVAHWLDELDVTYRVYRLFDGQRPTTYGDGIIALGGRPSATDDTTYPYLTWEKRYLANAATKKVPIFGICLGLQLLSLALGGSVDVRGPRGVESGIIHLSWTDDVADDPVMGPVYHRYPQGVLVAADHADGIDCAPTQSQILAYSSQHYIHAMRNGSVIAVQFHPEADEQRVHLWERGRGFTPGTITDPWATHRAQLEDMGRLLTHSFIRNGAKI